MECPRRCLSTRPTILLREVDADELELGRERTSLVIILENNLSDLFKDFGILLQSRRYIAVVTKKPDRAVEEFLELFSGHEMVQGSGFVRGCEDDQISKLPLRTDQLYTLSQPSLHRSDLRMCGTKNVGDNQTFTFNNPIKGHGTSHSSTDT